MKPQKNNGLIYKESRLYTIQVDDRFTPAELVYTPLSYRETQSLFEIFPDSQSKSRALRAFELGVVSTHNIEGLDLQERISVQLLKILSYDVILEVGYKIIELSIPTKEVFDTLSVTLDIGFDKNLQTDNWKCSICQERKLDKSRNCPLLGNETKDPSFRMYIKNQPHTYCMMADLDRELMHKAMECYRMFEAGILPEVGGFYDQTNFFIDATSIVKNRVQQAEMDAMAEVSSKKGRKR